MVRGLVTMLFATDDKTWIARGKPGHATVRKRPEVARKERAGARNGVKPAGVLRGPLGKRPRFRPASAARTPSITHA
jgi:hypothetical protein